MDNDESRPESPAPSSASASGSAPDFGDTVPVDLGAGEVVDTPAPEADAGESPEATAGLLVDGLDAYLRTLGRTPPPVDYPLTADERADLRRALVPVLAKYGVDELPYAEEIALGVTAGRIIIPRARRARAEKEGRAHDRAEPRQEGGREDGPAPEAGAPPSGSAREGYSLLE